VESELTPKEIKPGVTTREDLPGTEQIAIRKYALVVLNPDLWRFEHEPVRNAAATARNYWELVK